MTRATDGASEPVASLHIIITGAIRKTSSGIGEKMICYTIKSVDKKCPKTDKKAAVRHLHTAALKFKT